MTILENSAAEYSHAVVEHWAILYTRDLYAYAYRKTSDYELSKDLTQDTLLTALQMVYSFQGRSSPKTWLIAILDHKIIDHFRKESRSPIVQLPDWNALLNECIADDHLLDDLQFRMMLQRSIGLLPSHWQEIIKLRYLEEKDGKEICNRLEISTTNYWQIISRARSYLKRLIKEQWSME